MYIYIYSVCCSTFTLCCGELGPCSTVRITVPNVNTKYTVVITLGRQTSRFQEPRSNLATNISIFSNTLCSNANALCNQILCGEKRLYCNNKITIWRTNVSIFWNVVWHTRCAQFESFSLPSKMCWNSRTECVVRRISYCIILHTAHISYTRSHSKW